MCTKQKCPAWMWHRNLCERSKVNQPEPTDVIVFNAFSCFLREYLFTHRNSLTNAFFPAFLIYKTYKISVSLKTNFSKDY